jgi:hypothetical protein
MHPVVREQHRMMPMDLGSWYYNMCDVLPCHSPYQVVEDTLKTPMCTSALIGRPRVGKFWKLLRV